jgi:hypothetical protein
VGWVVVGDKGKHTKKLTHFQQKKERIPSKSGSREIQIGLIEEKTGWSLQKSREDLERNFSKGIL